VTGENLLSNVGVAAGFGFYRMGFGASRTEARQVFAPQRHHSERRRVNIPSYQVRAVIGRSGRKAKAHLRIKAAQKNCGRVIP